MNESYRLTNIECWKKPAGYEWDRIQKMRKDNHPLTRGGQSREVSDAERAFCGIKKIEERFNIGGPLPREIECGVFVEHKLHC